MKLKILSLVLGSILLAGGAAHAHCGACGVGDAIDKANKTMKGVDLGDYDKKMQKKLGVTAEEAQKLQEAKEVLMKKIAAAEKDYLQKVEKILSPEQMDKFMHMKGSHGHGPKKGSGKGSKKGSH